MLLLLLLEQQLRVAGSASGAPASSKVVVGRRVLVGGDRGGEGNVGVGLPAHGGVRPLVVEMVVMLLLLVGGRGDQIRIW